MQHARVLCGVALVALVALLGGCSATVGPGAPTEPPVDGGFDNPPVDTTSAPGGTWTGTITLHGVIDYSKEEPGHSDLDPNNTYYETWVTTEETQTDVTDTFTVNGVDDDLTYGVHSVDFEGFCGERRDHAAALRHRDGQAEFRLHLDAGGRHRNDRVVERLR